MSRPVVHVMITVCVTQCVYISPNVSVIVPVCDRRCIDWSGRHVFAPRASGSARTDAPIKNLSQTVIM